MSTTAVVMDRAWVAGSDLERALLAAVDEVRAFPTLAEALGAMTRSTPALVMVGIPAAPAEGMRDCRELLNRFPHLPMVGLGTTGRADEVLAALRLGVDDYLTRDAEASEVECVVRGVLERASLHRRVHRLREVPVDGAGPAGMIGKSSVMRDLFDRIRRVAPTESSVLITGESGTGKELVARALHEQSDRAEHRFVALNCAAVPASLLESELFGHERGAFTGALRPRKGLFLEADGGTVLLDEIGEMPAEMQATLLRVLQERRVRPLGAIREVPFDVRVITATHRDLEREMKAGRFREDLFFRLNVVPIHVPPLRERGGDVLLLAQRFLEEMSAQLERPVEGLSPEAARHLLEYDWPGNVRQLENYMERAVALGRFTELTPDDLPKGMTGGAATPRDGDASASPSLLTLAEAERRHIRSALSATGGNKAEAARRLGIDRRTLYRKLKRLGLDEG